MAFDETLADRVRAIIRTDPTVSEKRMFGGLAFLASGNMSVGVLGTELIVRVDPAEGVTLLNCPVPCDYLPKRSYPLFRAREVLEYLALGGAGGSPEGDQRRPLGPEPRRVSI